MSRPALQQLHAPVDRSGHKHHDAYNCRSQNHAHFGLAQDLAAAFEALEDHPGEEEREDDDGGQLEEHTCDHDSRS